MIVAVILDIICLTQLDSATKKILLFETNSDLVTAIDEDLISLADTNYLCLWLLSKQAVRIYCDEIRPAGKEFLEKAGIEVLPLESIRDHPILKALLLKENKDS